VHDRFTWWKGVILAVALVWTLFPIYWMINTSLKLPSEWLAQPPVWFSSRPNLDSYVAILAPGALQGGAFGAVTDSALPAIFTSVVISLVSTSLSLVVGLMAALAISRYNFGGNATPFGILASRMFPPIAIAIPIVILFATLGLIDTFAGLILAYAVFTVSFSTWMLKSFIDDVPVELEEAAMMDGMSPLKAHWTVTVPLIKGGIAATFLFIFILNWSEFLFALMLSASRVVTIPVQLSRYIVATSGTLYGPQAALGVLAIIPLFVIGVLIQQHLVRGITFGAIKR
jgi:multiple sugar transport system permease protein